MPLGTVGSGIVNHELPGDDAEPSRSSTIRVWRRVSIRKRNLHEWTTSYRRHCSGLRSHDTEGPIQDSTSGSAIRGACCSRIPRTSRRCARPSSDTWPSIKPEFDRRRRQGHRSERRSGGKPSRMVQGHRGDAGDGAELSDDCRLRSQGRQAVRHASGRTPVRRQPAARPRTTRRSATSTSSDPTRRSSWSSRIR